MVISPFRNKWHMQHLLFVCFFLGHLPFTAQASMMWVFGALSREGGWRNSARPKKWFVGFFGSKCTPLHCIFCVYILCIFDWNCDMVGWIDCDLKLQFNLLVPSFQSNLPRSWQLQSQSLRESRVQLQNHVIQMWKQNPWFSLGYWYRGWNPTQLNNQ